MQRIKEIYEELEQCTDNAVRLDLLAELSTHFVNTDLTRCAEVVEQIGALAKHTNDHRAFAFYHSGLGRLYYRNSQFGLALVEFEKAVESAKMVGDSRLESNCYHSLGMVYWHMGMFEKSLEVSMLSLNFFSDEDKTGNKAMCYNSIGNIHERLGEYDKAEAAYLKGLDILNSLGEERMLYNVMGNLGLIKIRKKEFKSAIEYLKPVHEGFMKLKHLNGEQLTLVQLGNAYVGLGQYAKGMNFYTKALKSFKQSENKIAEAEALVGLGNVYLHLEGYEDALKHFDKAMEIVLGINYHAAICDLYIDYANVYQAMKDITKAIEAVDKGLGLAQSKNLMLETQKLLSKKNELQKLSAQVA